MDITPPTPGEMRFARFAVNLFLMFAFAKVFGETFSGLSWWYICSSLITYLVLGTIYFMMKSANGLEAIVDDQEE